MPSSEERDAIVLFLLAAGLLHAGCSDDGAQSDEREALVRAPSLPLEGGTTMQHLGINARKKESWLRVLTEVGESIERRTSTERMQLADLCGIRCGNRTDIYGKPDLPLPEIACECRVESGVEIALQVG